MLYSSFNTPIGPVHAVMDAGYIVEIEVACSEAEFLERMAKRGVRGLKKASGPFKELNRQLSAYFVSNGVPFSFDLPMLARGTAFEQKVWEAIGTIPYGSVVSYTELARMSGCPRSVRAVANACGKNPLPIVIPCHRVVAKAGLGGYTGGTDIKKALLGLEGALCKIGR